MGAVTAVEISSGMTGMVMLSVMLTVVSGGDSVLCVVVGGREAANVDVDDAAAVVVVVVVVVGIVVEDTVLDTSSVGRSRRRLPKYIFSACMETTDDSSWLIEMELLTEITILFFILVTWIKCRFPLES